MAKLLGKLPAGEKNGLPAADIDLAKKRPVVVIAILGHKKSVEDSDSGETEVFAKIRAIEVVATVDLDKAEQLMRRAMETRTGQTVLPIDMEDELDLVFEQIVDLGDSE